MNGWARLGTERNGLARSDSAKERELWVAFWLTNRQGNGWGGQSERILGLVCFVWGVEVLCPVRPRKVSQSSCFCKIMDHVLYYRDQGYMFLNMSNITNTYQLSEVKPVVRIPSSSIVRPTPQAQQKTEFPFLRSTSMASKTLS